MVKRYYLLLVGIISGSLVFFVDRQNPYGPDFREKILPTVVTLNALQWLALPVKAILRVTGVATSLLVAGFFLAAVVPHRVGLMNFAASISLLMLAQAAMLYRFSSNHAVKSIVTAQSLTLVFLIMLGAYVNAQHIQFDFAADGAFLLWSPLAALLLWIESTTTSWNKWKRGLFIVLLSQLALGFLDVGMGKNVTAMKIFSGLFFLSAFILLICWADKLYPSKKVDVASPR